MLLPLPIIQKMMAIQPSGILHIGAHEAEEYELYRKLNWGHITWIEAQEDLAKKLFEKLPASSNTVINAAVWDKSGIKMKLNVANNSQSTSLLDFGTHGRSYPSIHFNKEVEIHTKRVDELFDSLHGMNFINLDIQGAEGRALRGFGNLLHQVDYLYTEVNKEYVYEGCDLVSDLDLYLKEFGLKRIITRWVPRKGWGDAMYVRNPSGLRVIGAKIYFSISNIYFASFEYLHLLVAKFRSLSS